MRVFTDRRFTCRCFTLVEIIAVMAILGILMGIGVGVYSLAMNKAKRSKTEALIKKLEISLEAFKAKYGYYPQTANTATKPYFYLNLYDMHGKSGDWWDGTVADQSSKDELDYFMKTIDYQSVLNSSTLDHTAANPVIVDAWGGRIYYRCPGKTNTSSFDIGSAGPDGSIGGTKLWKPNGDVNIADPVFDIKTSDDIANY